LDVDVPELFLSFSSLAICMAQLNLHLIEVSFHLLFDSQGIISASDFSIQSALHGINDSLAVSLDLFNLLILLSQLPINFPFYLVQLKLNTKNLGFFML